MLTPDAYENIRGLTRRVYMANRGIWDAVAFAGPQASFAHDENDVDRHLEVAEGFLDETVA